MTPFNQFVISRRIAMGLTQGQVADRLGVDSSYINRLERRGKAPGNLLFLERLGACLELNAEDKADLLVAAKASQGVIRLAENLSPIGYVFAADVASGLPTLCDEQIGLLRMIFKAIQSGQANATAAAISS
jgi:transcriptional regulator with XRE-family HTH domain